MNIQIICKDCLVKKPVDEFYGVQSECKDCTKKRVRAREQLLRQNPEWVEKEKIRARERYHRLGYKNIHKPTPEMKKATTQRYKDKYPEKISAKSMSSSLSPTIIGNHLHHWSYNDEHFKDVIELTVRDHNIAHRYMVYDQERKMYRTVDGTLLDTKAQHNSYILDLIEFYKDKT